MGDRTGIRGRGATAIDVSRRSPPGRTRWATSSIRPRRSAWSN